MEASVEKNIFKSQGGQRDEEKISQNNGNRKVFESDGDDNKMQQQNNGMNLLSLAIDDYIDHPS